MGSLGSSQICCYYRCYCCCINEYGGKEYINERHAHKKCDRDNKRKNLTFRMTTAGGKHKEKQYDPHEIHCPQHQLLLMVALQVFITTEVLPQCPTLHSLSFFVSVKTLFGFFTSRTSPLYTAPNSWLVTPEAIIQRADT